MRSPVVVWIRCSFSLSWANQSHQSRGTSQWAVILPCWMGRNKRQVRLHMWILHGGRGTALLGYLSLSLSLTRSLTLFLALCGRWEGRTASVGYQEVTNGKDGRQPRRLSAGVVCLVLLQVLLLTWPDFIPQRSFRLPVNLEHGLQSGSVFWYLR